MDALGFLDSSDVGFEKCIKLRTDPQPCLQHKSCAVVSNRITISILTIFTIQPWLATLFLQKSISAENCNKIGYPLSPPTHKLFPKPALPRLSQLPKVCFVTKPRTASLTPFPVLREERGGEKLKLMEQGKEWPHPPPKDCLPDPLPLCSARSVEEQKLNLMQGTNQGQCGRVCVDLGCKDGREGEGGQ